MNINLQDALIKTNALEINIDHISIELSKVRDKFDKISPIIDRIDVRLDDYINFRDSTEKRFAEHAKLINELTDIAKQQKTIMNISKWLWRVMAAFILTACGAGYTIYKDVYERKHIAIEDKREERDLKIKELDSEIRRKQLDLMME
jgi:hypothetical protein